MEQKPIQHLAIIPDGNGRWAQNRHMPRSYGHYIGYKQVKKIIDLCIKKNIKTLTFYTLSRYNMGRKAVEIKYLLRITINLFLKFEVKKLHKKNIKLNFIGDYKLLNNKTVSEGLEKAMELTKNNTGLNLNLAVAYSGRWDLVQAFKKMHQALINGQMIEQDINESILPSFTQLANLPDPEFCIRTGGEYRISDFCLWQLAYSELYFTDTLWPEFNEKELDMALDNYFSRQRRFGLEAK